MLSVNRFVRRLPNYIRRFGAINGVAMAAHIERQLPRSAARVRQVVVPGWRAPVSLRDSMGDHATFWQCVVSEQYGLDRFPQTKRLKQAYASALARKEVPLIIDCGANIGLAALWFANEFPEARIIAVEPDQNNFALLQQNIAPYGDGIIAMQGGIWPSEGFVRIENPTAGSAAFRVVPCDHDHVDAVRTFTIPSLCASVDAKCPFIVKIDIEGAQGPLFSQHTEWVRDSALIVLELDDWQLPWTGTSRSFFSTISQWPFDYLLGGESIFCFRDVDAAPERHRICDS